MYWITCRITEYLSSSTLSATYKLQYLSLFNTNNSISRTERTKTLDMFCVIYDHNSIYILRELVPDQLNLRKSEQTFQQCKYNNNNLASIQFHIVYSMSKRKKFCESYLFPLAYI